MTTPPETPGTPDAAAAEARVRASGLRAWGGVIAAVVLLGWFVWLARDVLWEAFGVIGDASVPLLLVAVGMQMLHLVLRAWRWGLLLAPVKRHVGFYNLFSTTVIGYFASTLLPFRVGELVRPLMLAGREGIRRSSAIATVGVERILDTLTVFGFLATYLLLFAEDLDSGARSSSLWAKTLAWAPLAGVAMLVAIPILFLVARFEATLFRWIRALLHVHEGGALDRALGIAQSFVGGMAVLSRPGPALVAVGASVAVWLAIAGATWFGVLAMGLRFPNGFPFRATLLLVPLLAVGVSTPTPGGAGGYHIICELALEQIFGADRAGAWATALVLWLISMLPMIVMGFFFLWRSGNRVGDLGRLARTSG